MFLVIASNARGAAAASVLVGLLLLFLGVGDVRADDCSRMEPSLSPSWILGGAWAQDGSLLLLEPSTHRVLRYDTTVPGITTLPGRAEEALANLQARALSRSDHGFVFQLPEDVFMTLDSRFRQAGMFRLSGPGAFDDIAPFQWTTVGRDIVVCGDIDLPGKTGDGGEDVYEHGIFRLSLQNPVQSYTLLREISLLDPMSVYCRLGLPLIAGVGDDVPVVLFFGESVELLAYPGGKETPIEVIPADYGQAPRLPPNPTRGQYRDLMQKIEAADMPYGIFSEGDDLFLLLRSPAAGGAQWDVIRISMANGGEAKYQGKARLPSRARHLAVVPGAERFAFLEKGEIEKIGEQGVDGVLFIPTEQLAGITGEDQLLCK